jgi:hypothetical protein
VSDYINIKCTTKLWRGHWPYDFDVVNFRLNKE